MRTLSRLSLASFSFALAAVACGAPAGDDENPGPEILAGRVVEAQVAKDDLFD